MAIGTDVAVAVGSKRFVVQGLIKGRWKLLVGQLPMSGWQGPVYPNASTNWIAQHDFHQCSAIDASREKRACLFDILADPTEHRDVAGENLDVVNQMLERIEAINGTAYTPGRGKDTGKACEAAFARGKVWGPFL